ncbi:nuclear transport factor 2 family protein [Natronorubrum sp. FCH18a]|uniref:nuclear transport factor 2 family protein n=1 Tax=Natronorubrum sp. FCH18a TaxID=3447018 RepID=UPI003F51781D
MATTQRNNVEIAEQLYDAFNRGDLEECLAGFADDITWTVPEGLPFGAGTHHGPEAIMEGSWAPLLEHFDHFDVVIDRFIDGGDTVVMEGTHRATTPDGDVIEVPAVHVVDMAEGKVQQFTSYEDTALTQQLLDE